ncbi:hypothetical protein [Archangium sp.]|uniref:hypothetical protein n=1 Tax=Archangium sp. TaxID=1872627 RepID=UPI002D5D398A|nr:hypothetical protein [Archangium sp.]HYO52450.1 hypothetical protein [Archangium sp.]
MAQCEVCGNDYDKSFQVKLSQGATHVFDSFECAASALAPRCGQCNTRILGHGLEANGTMYCCANCARKAGVQLLRDHV